MLELHVNVTYKLIKTIIIIIKINKDKNVERKDKENKDKILLIN